MKYLMLVCLLFSAPAFAASHYIPDASLGFDKMDFEEQAEFDQLVGELVEDVCGYNIRLAKAKSDVDRQKEIERVSGTADIRVLHAAASTLVDIKPIRDQKASLFKKTMGRDIKASDCEE
jgi:hypothetical protein